MNHEKLREILLERISHFMTVKLLRTLDIRCDECKKLINCEHKTYSRLEDACIEIEFREASKE